MPCSKMQNVTLGLLGHGYKTAPYEEGFKNQSHRCLICGFFFFTVDFLKGFFLTLRIILHCEWPGQAE